MNHLNGNIRIREGKNIKHNKNYIRNERDGHIVQIEGGRSKILNTRKVLKKIRNSKIKKKTLKRAEFDYLCKYIYFEHVYFFITNKFFIQNNSQTIYHIIYTRLWFRLCMKFQMQLQIFTIIIYQLQGLQKTFPVPLQ